MEGVRTENCLRIRNYSLLERILIILRYRVKNGYGSEFSLFLYSGSGLRYRYLLSFYQCLNNLFSANFLFVFCRIFAGKVTIFYRKRALKSSIIFMFRPEVNWTSGWSATPSPREPNPCRSMDGRAWRPYADSTKSLQMMRARFNSMPTTQVSAAFCFLNSTVSRFWVHFSYNTVQFQSLFKGQPIGTFFLIDRFHFFLLQIYRSGFEPSSIIFFHCELWIRIWTVFQIGVSFKSLFC